MNERCLFRGKRILETIKGSEASYHVGEWVIGDRRRVKSRYAPQIDTAYRIADEYNHSFLVDPLTIGQCVGYYDKNGTLIFEGDILKRELFRRDIIGEVVWRDSGFTGFMLKVVGDDSIRFYSIGRGQFDDDEGDKCNDEIIGNIYDNKKLLSVSDSDTKGD